MSKKPSRVVALDIETTGLNPWKDEISLVGFWDGKHYSYARTREEFASHLSAYDGYQIVGHNIAFDVRFLIVNGWASKSDFEGRIHDTQLMAHVCTTKVPASYIEQYEERRKELNKELGKGVSHRPARSLSLKVLAPWFLKVPPFWETPDNHDNLVYNQKDCEYTLRLFDKLWPMLEDAGREFYEMKMLPWAWMLLEMTLTGINIDMDALDALESKLKYDAANLKDVLDEQWREHLNAWTEQQVIKIRDRYAAMRTEAIDKAKDKTKTKERYDKLEQAALEKVEQLNYASPAQMSWLLKDRLGLDITKIDNEEEESTGKAVLHKLAGQGRGDIKQFLDWRATNKLLTAFIPTYKELQANGVLHPTFNITGTRTGRTSSADPNIQQAPPEIMELFHPGKGRKFIKFDLSGIEAVLIALYSEDERLFNLLQNGESIHDHNTKILFDLDTPVGDVKKRHPAERQTAKNLGFAVFYGAGWRRIQTVFQTAGFTVSDARAKELLQALKRSYKKVFEFHRDITDVAVSGEVIYNLFGRPVVIPDPQDAYMKAFNTLIQSGASDLNLEACRRATINARELGFRAVAVIHDCIIATAPTETAEQCATILKKEMTGFKLKNELGQLTLQVEGGIYDRL